MISDQVILIANGMIVAEGQVRSVREEIHEHSSQFVIRCRDASRIAALLFEQDHIAQIKVHDDRLGLVVMTRNRTEFSRALTRISLAGHTVEKVMAVDDDVDALYQYLNRRRRMTAASRARQAWTIARLEVAAGVLLQTQLLDLSAGAVSRVDLLHYATHIKLIQSQWAGRQTDAALLEAVREGDTDEEVLRRVGEPLSVRTYRRRRATKRR